MFPISKRKLLLLEEMDEERKIFIIFDSDANTVDRHNRQVRFDANQASMQTCLLCRSTVFALKSEIMTIFHPTSTSSSNNNFRLEIGNISNRCETTATDSNNVARETDRKTSVGTFEYFIDEEAEIPVGNTNRRIFSSEKDDAAVHAVEVVAPVVSQASLVGEGNWLKDYIDSLSRVMSFRGSGRFFTGCSRRKDVVAGVGDFHVDANISGFGERD